MGYPPEIFQQTQVFAVQAGQLLLDQGSWALGVQVDEGRGPEQCILYLEGEMRGEVRVPDERRMCCRLADGYKVIVRANGRPQPFREATPAGELVHGGGEPLIRAKLGGKTATYSIKGDRVAPPRSEQGVAYSEWEICITDANGAIVEGAPVVSVKAV